MINIGNEATKAVQELRGNRDFDELLESLKVIVQTKMFEASAVPPDQRVDKTSYALGLYHFWASLNAAHQGLHPNQAKPPITGKRMLTNAQ